MSIDKTRRAGASLLVFFVVTIFFAQVPAARAAQAPPKMCLVSVQDSSGKAKTRSMQKRVEAAIRQSSSVRIVPRKTFRRAAVKAKVAEKDWMKPAHLGPITKELGVDIAAMIFVTQHASRFRVLFVTIDAKDGKILAKASQRLSRPVLSKAGAQEMVKSAIRGSLEALAAKQDALRLAQTTGGSTVQEGDGWGEGHEGGDGQQGQGDGQGEGQGEGDGWAQGEGGDQSGTAGSESGGWGEGSGEGESGGGWGQVSDSGGSWSASENATSADASMEAGGYLMAHYAGLVGAGPLGQRWLYSSGNTPKSGEFVVAEERLGFDIKAWSRSVEASVQVKGDLYYDNIFRSFGFYLREGYIDYSYGPLDVRLGRQMATWGLSEFVSVNDVFPKDWQSYLLGRPIDYFKIGIDALRLNYSSQLLSVEWMLMPVFTPDVFPSSDRFIFVDPFAAHPQRVARLPQHSSEQMEMAVRMYTKLWIFDLSTHLYRGFWRTPSYQLDGAKLLEFYPPLYVAGLHLQAGILASVLSFEAGYYYSPDDPHGDIYEVPNSQVRGLVSLQSGLWSNATLTLQYYGEYMTEHQAYQDSVLLGLQNYEQPALRHAGTVRFEQLLFNQNLKLSLVAYYSYVDSDFFVQTQLSYNVSDRLSVVGGFTIIDGRADKPWGTAGQFRENDNAFVSIRHFF